MGRLIDADRFLKGIELGESYDIIGLKYVIDRQPTAYDVDKVVTELKKQSHIVQNNASHFKRMVDLNRAINIVEGTVKDE